MGRYLERADDTARLTNLAQQNNATLEEFRQKLAAGGGQQAALIDLVETLNANVEKINRLLFTYLDYAAIGRRG